LSPGVIYHACTSTPHYQSAHKIEIPSFTHFKYMTEAPQLKT